MSRMIFALLLTQSGHLPVPLTLLLLRVMAVSPHSRFCHGPFSIFTRR